MAQEDNLFLRLFTPRNASDPRTAVAAYPSGDISLLDGIAPIGTKFSKPADTGPEGEPNNPAAAYEKALYYRTLYFYFGDLATPTP